jgi:hypothetical protein
MSFKKVCTATILGKRWTIGFGELVARVYEKLSAHE